MKLKHEATHDTRHPLSGPWLAHWWKDIEPRHDEDSSYISLCLPYMDVYTYTCLCLPRITWPFFDCSINSSWTKEVQIYLRYFYSISALSCLVIRLLLYRVPRIDLLDWGVTCWGQPRTSIPFLELCPPLSCIYLWVIIPLPHSVNRAPSCLLTRIWSTKICFKTQLLSTTISISLGGFSSRETRPS